LEARLPSVDSGWSPRKFLDAWKQAFGLGTVAKLWPKTLAWDVNLAHQVERILATGGVTVNSGGKPKNADLREKRQQTANDAQEVAQEVGEAWGRAMQGIDVHGLRKTHRTWVQGRVPGAATDAQLGHSDAPTDQVAKLWLGSKTGQRHYTDSVSAMLRPELSAHARAVARVPTVV
jgi:hypothetical protein